MSSPYRDAKAGLDKYIVDAGMSRFLVRGTAGGMLSGLGHNPLIAIRDITGEALVDPAAPERSSLQLEIKTASLEVQNDVSEKDRREMKRVMDQETLEIGKYPEIVYESTGVSAPGLQGGGSRATIDGNLTLHGVTRPQRVATQLSLLGGTLRANGEFSVRQSDFRITPPSVAGGVLKLKDELKVTFDIVARKAQT